MRKRFKYTPEHLEFLREGYRTMNADSLAIAFNAEFGTDKTKVQIKSALSSHKIRCGRKGNDRLILNRRRVYTKEHKKFIRTNYPKFSIKELTKCFNERFSENKTERQLKAFITNNKIHSGRTGCFEKGHKPWNAGTKGVVKPNSGNFKKGHVPANTKPIGHERICSKDGYVLVKVAETNPYTGAPTRYKPKHVHIWEQENGSVPKGHIVAFRDKSKKGQSDISIEELELITMEENMRRNTIHNLPETLAEVCRIRGVLNRHINKRIKK